MPDGTIRALSVYVGIDAAADPALAALARAGTLHHIADGVELAIPFVYHDPACEALLLVVPEGLRHRALSLRAEHMALIAADAGHAVPDYVRDAELVVGARGLCARLESGERSAKLQSVAQKAEGDMRALLHRERELMRRERLLRARERALSASERDASQYAAEAGDTPVDDAEVEEVGDLLGYEDDRYGVASGQVPSQPFPSRAQDALADAGDIEDAEDDVEEVGEVDEVEDLIDTQDVAEVDDSELLDGDLDRAYARVSQLDLEGFFSELSEAELRLTESDGRVVLFVRNPPRPPRDRRGIELLLQLDPSADVPVALVTLVFDQDGSPEVRRGAIGPLDAESLRALALLAEHFEVELVAVFGPEAFEPIARVAQPREGNARAVLNRLTHDGEGHDEERLLRARLAALRAPPAWRELAHPFQPSAAWSPPESAIEAAVQLDALAPWLTTEGRERLRLLWCVPDERIDLHLARCLGAALDWGLALSEAHAARALELGLSQDRRALLERRIHGLCRVSRASEEVGLEASVLRTLWSEALEQAARLGVALSAEAHELASAHAGERAVVHAAALSEEPSPELERLRERLAQGPAEVDEAALHELLVRGSYRDLLSGAEWIERLPPARAARLFAAIVLRDDPVAVDALLALLGPEHAERIRVGAALGLSRRRAVHAIEEIAGCLEQAPVPAWKLFALALGRYGGGSFRAIARQLSTHKVDAERTSLVFALLSCHGARSQLKAKGRSTDPAEAALAQGALARASEAGSDERRLLSLEEGADLTVFCAILDESTGPGRA